MKVTEMNADIFSRYTSSIYIPGILYTLSPRPISGETGEPGKKKVGPLSLSMAHFQTYSE